VTRALIALLAAGCGCGSTTADSAEPKGSAAAPAAAAATGKAIELPSRPLGEPDLAAYQWRKRAGQPAFREARRAEQRSDWPMVATMAGKALALDPSNLEAAWLLAAADGALGRQGDLVAPLTLAAAGDFGKWGPASLELPELQPWLATPTGDAWRRRVDADRATYVAALARSVVVLANGDLYAVDVGDAASPRWYRLTRTYGGVLAAFALPAQHRLAYLTRTRTHRGIGLVDLQTGHASRPAELGPGTVRVEARAAGGAWLGLSADAPTQLIDLDGKLAGAPAHARADGASLAVFQHTARLERRADDITADFDDRGLASQIRLDTSTRVVSVPAPGQIDGSSLAWSPDRVHLAFVAQLEDRCTAGARAAVAVFIVDAATGVARELERASGGLAVEWLADGRVAIAGDRGVSIYDLARPGEAPRVLAGATDLVTPRRVPRCVPVDAGSDGDDADD
jgi:hypothetical protein